MSTGLDKTAVAQLVAEERHWRDTGRWDRMAAAYAPDCEIRLAWFRGTAPDFVRASRAGGRGGTTKHRLSPSVVEVHGNRAVAETSVVVETRTTQDGLEVDLFSRCRYLNRLTRDTDGWLLAGVDCICEKDSVEPVYPDDELTFDRDLLAGFRPSYRFVTYNLLRHGITASNDLPGDDRPDLTSHLYAVTDEWLQTSTGG